jgi:putative hydrolase
MEVDSTNRRVAEKLLEAADLLGQQGANPFRVAAYRRAADTVAGLPRDIAEILDERGLEGLVALPNVGHGIARAIQEMLGSRRWRLLERLRGGLDPEKLFQTIPTVGPEVARAIHETLHLDSLEALEVAVHDGRILAVPGIGPRRAEVMRNHLALRLGRRMRPQKPELRKGPRIVDLLDVDREYRRRAAAGELPTIAPKRFNPDGKAWLPILHTERGHWHFTALYSNTALAHQLERTRDWVVIYFYDDHHQEGQHTVVTETRGSLSGRRVVRGREVECRGHYERLPAAPSPDH